LAQTRTKKHLKEKKEEIDGFKNTRAQKQIRILKAYKRKHIKQTLDSLRLNEFKLTALTT